MYILKCLLKIFPVEKDPFFIIIKYLTVKTNSSLKLYRISPAFANETGTPEKLYRKSVRFLLIIVLCKVKRKRENGVLMVKN